MTDPYRLDTPAVVSFSGGRTSGFMLWHILDAFGGTLPDDVKVVFCNTGKERPETLDFVERCSQRWGVPVTWLEYRHDGKTDEYEAVGRVREVAVRDYSADLDDDEYGLDTGETKVVADVFPVRAPGKGKPTFAVVDYATASRNGEPFERLITVRSMLPNVVARFCTVELKIRTTRRYLKAIGWDFWTNAIGLRADEPHRVARLGNKANQHSNEDPIAPLATAGVTLADVNAFWDRQPFRLGLAQHEGNCDLCFLKGAGKIRAILSERPDLADWWIAQEERIPRRAGGGTDQFRRDRPPYRIQLELAQRPGLFDEFEPDELSIACHCTD